MSEQLENDKSCAKRWKLPTKTISNDGKMKGHMHYCRIYEEKVHTAASIWVWATIWFTFKSAKACSDTSGRTTPISDKILCEDRIWHPCYYLPNRAVGLHLFLLGQKGNCLCFVSRRLLLDWYVRFRGKPRTDLKMLGRNHKTGRHTHTQKRVM